MFAGSVLHDRLKCISFYLRTNSVTAGPGSDVSLLKLTLRFLLKVLLCFQFKIQIKTIFIHDIVTYLKFFRDVSGFVINDTFM